MSEALAKDIIEFIMVNYKVVLSILSNKAIVDSLNYSKLECELQSLWLSEHEVPLCTSDCQDNTECVELIVIIKTVLSVLECF